MPQGGVYLIFIGPGGRGFELSFCLGGGEFGHRKNGDGQAWD